MFKEIGRTLHNMQKWECIICGSVYTTRKRRPKIFVAKDKQEGCKFCWVNKYRER